MSELYKVAIIGSGPAATGGVATGGVAAIGSDVVGGGAITDPGVAPEQICDADTGACVSAANQPGAASVAGVVGAIVPTTLDQAPALGSSLALLVIVALLILALVLLPALAWRHFAASSPSAGTPSAGTP